MTTDWYIFKEVQNSNTMEYLGFLSYTIPTGEKQKQFEEICKKHHDCYVWAMKVIKGVQV